MYRLMMNCGPACGCGSSEKHGRSEHGRGGGRLERRLLRQIIAPAMQQQLDGARWRPAIDVKEDAQAFYLSADLPGVQREDIQLELEEGLLTLRAERRLEEASEGADWRWVGRQYGSFRRRFRLPRNADVEGISAELKDGVLSITLPKNAASVSKQVSIG